MLQFFKKLYENVKNLFTPKMEAQSTEVDMEAAGTQIKYYLNDPSTPNLMGYANNPQTYKLQFAVKYFTGNGGPLDRPVGQAANVYAVLCHSINVLNRKADLSKWAVVNKLNVDPLAGVQANAFYDRQGLKFFYFTNKGQKVFTCLSADIITHELGHGLLDAMRPEFFNMAALELWAFHESFGDVSAILSSLAQPAVVKNMLETTGGDLRKPNIVEGLAEQFGSSLGLGGALRKGVNNFKYVSPSTLPQRAPNDQLAAESHSFSRVLTGAFYEIFVKAYEMFGKGVSGVDQARELLMETFINASKKAPSSSNFFQVFSKTWLDILKLKSPTIGEQMRLILVNRNLLGLPMSMQSSSFSQDKFDLVKQNLLES